MFAGDASTQVALQKRAQRKWIPRARDEPIQVVQRHARIADAGQVFTQLLAHDRQQIQGQAGGGHADQIAVPPVDILHT